MGFDLTTRMGYDGRGFSAGLQQNLGEAKEASAKLSTIFANSFKGGVPGLGGIAGTFGVGKLFSFLEEQADHVVEKFKETKMAARQMGVDMDLAARIANVTTATGAGPEAVAVAMDHVAIALEKIHKGEPGFEKIIGHMRTLGVTAKEMEEGTRQGVTMGILGRFEGQKDITDAQVEAMHALMGRGGPHLIPAGQLGFNSATANAGIPGEGFEGAQQHNSDIERTIENSKRQTKTDVGANWRTVRDWLQAKGMLLGGVDVEATLKKEKENAEETARLMAQENKHRKAKADREAEELVQKRIRANQREADQKAASDVDKETAKFDEQIRKEQQRTKYDALSDEEKKAFQRERLANARRDQAGFERNAKSSFSVDGEADELGQAKYRRMASQAGLEASEAEMALGQLDRKKEHHPKAINHDALLDVGNFLGGAAGQDENTKMLREMGDHLKTIRHRLESFGSFGNSPLNF